MKRFLSLLLLLAAVAGWSACKADHPDLLNREAVLPDSLVSLIAGTPMKPVYDIREANTGVVRWAWEEMDGLPKLLMVDICFPPAECGRLYEEAKSGAGCEIMNAPAGAEACYDGRAAHILCGEYYIKVVSLGLPEEKKAMELIAGMVVPKINPKQ